MHDTSGIVYVQSNAYRTCKLGQFLDIWGGLDTNGKMIKATVDGGCGLIRSFYNLNINGIYSNVRIQIVGTFTVLFMMILLSLTCEQKEKH
jgi:hypothetical protein